MSSLKTTEKQPLEELFGMRDGYVLDFSNSTFASFIRETSSQDIYGDKYAINGDSKAKRFRAFWEIEPDNVVGDVLAELLSTWEYKNPHPTPQTKAIYDRCFQIINRLRGSNVGPSKTERELETEFLKKDFGNPQISKIQIEAIVIPILEARYEQMMKCHTVDAPLAAIFLCGSILEGLLLGVAMTRLKEFNQANQAPKDKVGQVKKFNEWGLADFIDVSCELGILRLDIKKFSHELRNFRNYIHPYQQMHSGFTPDKHTAEICIQVLKAAIAILSGQR